MKFSIVIPNITKQDSKFALLENCLKTFDEHHSGNTDVVDIIIVDDGSDEKYKPKIAELGKKFKAQVIFKEKNEGFSKAVNSGIAISKGDIVVLVNNDISFTEPVLNIFGEDFADPTVGIVGCLLFYPNKTIQHGGIIRHGSSFTHAGWHKKFEMAPEIHQKKFMIGVTGAMFAMSKKMIDDVGVFDETFFLASEDTQYCIRAWQKNWKVLFDPAAKAIHVEGGTRGSSDQEKMSQSIHTRNWFIQEMKTKTIFLNWLKTIDLSEIDRRINEANNPIPDIQPVAKHSSDVKIIGVRRTGALGDVLMTTPILRELKKRYPQSKIIFATHSPDALAGNTYIHKVVGTIDQIRAETPVVYDLDLAYENNPKMNIVDAYSMVAFGETLKDKSLDLHSSKHDFDGAFAAIGGHVSFERDKVVVIHQAVSWKNRTWPIQYWNEVVRNLAAKGYKILVVGRGGDFKPPPIAGVTNMIDKLNIPQIRELIAHSKMFIGTDSGLMHIAQTTSTPVIGMFTVANPEYRITRHKDFYPIVPTSPCRYCLHEEKPPVTFVGCRVGTMQCLKEITPQAVTSMVDLVLRGK